MVLTISLSESWRVFFPIDSKEQKLIIPFVVSLKGYMEFHKVQFWVPYFSISISVTYFLTQSNVISQDKRTIMHHLTLISIYNHGHNIFRPFDTLPNFLFTTIETKRDY